MKKILGLTSLAVVFLLVACGGNNETVCINEDNFFGGELIARFESSDNEITSATMELRLDISGMSDEEIQDEIDRETSDGGVDYEIDGDTLIFSQTIEGGDELDALRISRNLEEMIADMEDSGATCD